MRMLSRLPCFSLDFDVMPEPGIEISHILKFEVILPSGLSFSRYLIHNTLSGRKIQVYYSVAPF